MAIKNNICVDEENYGNCGLLLFYRYLRNKTHFMIVFINTY